MTHKSRPFGVLVALIALLYPILVYVFWNSVPKLWLAALPLAALVIRAALTPSAGRSTLMIALSGIAAYLLVLLMMQERAVLYYPVIINVTLAATFAITLTKPPSLIESLSRSIGMEIPPEAVTYTHYLTMLWACFFALNALACSWIAVKGSLHYWAVYNGLVSNLVVAVLLVGEYLYRRRFKRLAAERKASVA